MRVPETPPLKIGRGSRCRRTNAAEATIRHGQNSPPNPITKNNRVLQHIRGHSGHSLMTASSLLLRGPTARLSVPELSARLSVLGSDIRLTDLCQISGLAGSGPAAIRSALTTY